MTSPEPRRLLTDLFEAAIGAADPRSSVKAWLPPRPRGRTVVIGAESYAGSWVTTV